MFKTCLIIAAAASALGLATLSIAQDSRDDEFMPVGNDPNWYLQRSTCTLAHSVNGESAAVVRLNIGMGVEMEFVDPALRRVRQGATAEFTVAVDGAREWSLGTGIEEENRGGYRLSLSNEILRRIAAGRRLEAKTGRQTLLRLDLAGAGPAVNAMRACYDAMAPEEGPIPEGNFSNAM